MMHGGRMSSFGGYFGHSFLGSGWNWLIGIGVVLIIAAVAYLVVKGGKKKAVSNEALEVLSLKFVKGEITEEEYLKSKNVLN